METQVSIVAELQDFFRRRAEVELDYSKNLDKLSKSLLARHKEQKQKYRSPVVPIFFPIPSTEKSERMKNVDSVEPISRVIGCYIRSVLGV